MKRVLIFGMALLMAGMVYAQDPTIPITGFEDGDGLAFSGSQVTISLEDDVSNPDGVPPHEGNGLLYVEYDTTGNVWSWNTLNFAAPVDITGMRKLHMWVYFLPDAMVNADNVYELRMRLNTDVTGDGNDNDVALGYKTITADGNAGQWLEFVWEIDSITSLNYLSALSGFDLAISPGDDNLTGAFYVDSIYASKPAGLPNDVEYVQVYNFDDEGDNAAPLGWQGNNAALIGIGDVPPSEGSNYMEIFLGAGWVNQAVTTDAKGASDLWAQATDIVMDVRISDEFTGGWLLLNPVMQSGGNDADGNPLEKVNGWDGYGEFDIFGAGYQGEWKTIAWPFRVDEHIDALTNDGGWFQVNLITNQDASQEGISLFVDNFRLAIPSGDVGVANWSLY